MCDLIGTKIKSLRLKNKLSQNELCGGLIDRSLLSKIENNHVEPSLAQLKYFSNKLKVSLNYFFNELNHDGCFHNEFKSATPLGEFYDNKSYEMIIKFIEVNSKAFDSVVDINKYFFAGMSYFNSGIKNESIKFLRKYVNSYLKSQQSIQENEVINFANALNTLSKIMLMNSNYTKALHYLHISKQYMLNYNKTDSLINFIIHNNLGHVYNDLNQYNKCISVLEEFLMLNKNLCYILIMPHIHWSLNIAYYNIGEFEKSIDHIQKSICLFSYTNDQYHLGRCYINYINTLRYWNKFDKAIELIKECKLKFFNDEELYNKFLVQEIAVYFNLERFDAILSLWHGMQHNKLDKNNKMDCYFILGHILYLNKNYNKSINYFIKCRKHFTNQNYTYDLSLLYEDLYKITNECHYLDKQNFYKNMVGRKNIMVN